MKKQHQRPEFIVINIDHRNERFFVASGTPPFTKFAGKIKSQQQNNSGGIPLNGAAGYDITEEIFNW